VAWAAENAIPRGWANTRLSFWGVMRSRLF
jgi:hypothetical protein